MTLTEWILIVTTISAAAGALSLAIRERRKPELDAAQAASAIVNSESIKQEIKKQSDLSNARRDLRLLALEKWGFDEVRPWCRDAVMKFDQQGDQIAELATALGRDVPRIHLAPPPEMPPPQAI